MSNKIKTRWQLRVGEDLEHRIRALSEKEHQSINQTVVHIITKYFEIVDLNQDITDSQLDRSDKTKPTGSV